ncbi:leucine-rich repeat protein SHOC-2-like [Anthonomus grandis grandis]|uniref:leucine-rich repeat protein SHOC-2-like n=1 Tax=Anthonomus grandis grandis TaxID=2921223 RepID=UPI0021668F79|nr:leucine-rich repeat protein SHOC-2-like [Anthonomus grandis grandis]
MSFDYTPKHHITLSNYKGELIIKKQEDTNPSEKTYQLASFFNIISDEKADSIKQGLNKITILDLSYCDLTELPKELKFLFLKVLNVSHNKLTAPPLCLYGNGLEKLEILDLSHNLITEFNLEPDCISTIKKLLINNNCFENIPSWFLTFRCMQLEELNYSNNRAEHYNFLKHFCNFSLMRLRKLEMRDTCLVDSDIAWLKCLKNLQILDISNKSLKLDRKCINRFKELNELFKHPRWTNLQSLTLCNLDISMFPEGVFWIVTLKELNVSHNVISWFPEGIEYLVNLECLDVSNNDMCIIPKEICHLFNLKVLLLAHNVLDEVPDLPENLEVLDLYDNKLETIQNISTFKKIKYKDFDYNYINLNDSKDYCTSRDQYRSMYGHKNRSSFPKFKESSLEYDDYSCSSDSDFDENPTSDLIPICDIEEDWDKECGELLVREHPDITQSDYEYEVEVTTHQFVHNKFKLISNNSYVSDEDWMFEDAD